ncbi:branched-chain amino acid ABC transporter permease [Caballeronia ptereochthonis]|uniref:Branched chain amino acid ABC transporter inner membrane protein n=1 Tax=Caballeronia ptereochthonis TaxID=1777144 RepID=A0A158C5L7_9BURK|nr:branched-chain amino acid ABC transporter permease [Caballeronia ptereochthonis]SAK77186.1 branched chain amino acid ABC transporter inner membrane protein [Caballeronia ptereochthonis]
MPDRSFPFWGLAVLALGAASLFAGGGYAADLVVWCAIAALTASSLRFVLLMGELNFATAAFFGIGAYTAGVCTTLWDIPFPVTLLLSGVLACAIGAVFGFITLRAKGPYFLLIGFAFAEVMRIVYTRSDWLGGNSGMVGIFPPAAFGTGFPAFVVLIVGVLLLVLHAIETSQFGKLLIAVRDNENVVRSVGIRVHLVKIACFCISCFVTGIAGSLHAFANNVISPPDFGFLLSTLALAYLKVGGEHHPLGPVAGAILLVLLGSFTMGLGASEHIFYGAAIVIAMLLLPGGLMGLLRGRMASAKTRRAALARPNGGV